jgi:hypothetical protein
MWIARMEEKAQLVKMTLDKRSAFLEAKRRKVEAAQTLTVWVPESEVHSLKMPSRCAACGIEGAPGSTMFSSASQYGHTYHPKVDLRVPLCTSCSEPFLLLEQLRERAIVPWLSDFKEVNRWPAEIRQRYRRARRAALIGNAAGMIGVSFFQADFCRAFALLNPRVCKSYLERVAVERAMLDKERKQLGV